MPLSETAVILAKAGIQFVLHAKRLARSTAWIPGSAENDDKLNVRQQLFHKTL